MSWCLDNKLYDDFLRMDNNEIMQMNGGKKFDICLMNPPYGNRNIGDEFLHHKFTEKALELSNVIVCIMPAKLIYDISRDKNRTHYKEIYNNMLISVEQLDSHVFSQTAMQSVGIFLFSTKKDNNIIKLDYLDGRHKEIKSLLDISQFSEYEKEFMKYLEIDIKDTNYYLCQDAKDEDRFNKFLNILQSKDKKVYMTSNSANGGMNGRFFSSRVGKIFTNVQDLKVNFNERKGAACVIMSFDDIKSAENCRDAMNRPLLRFGLYRTQDDQNLRRKVYKYIPNIDWSDDRVKTDEGLLEVCGCPKDKCKEYAEYCKRVIEEVDKKK